MRGRGQDRVRWNPDEMLWRCGNWDWCLSLWIVIGRLLLVLVWCCSSRDSPTDNSPGIDQDQYDEELTEEALTGAAREDLH